MSPRICEYKHRIKPQLVPKHRQIFWLYRHDCLSVPIIGTLHIKQLVLAKNER